MKTHKEELYRKYNRFEELDSSQSKELKHLLGLEIEALLKMNEEILDSEDYYLWGLIKYPDNVEYEVDLYESIEKFNQSLELDDSYFMARLYLAHCYQDLSDWETALENYLKVNQGKLRSEFPIWRYVKLVEQIGYCNFQLGNQDLALQAFEEVAGYYEKYPSDELAVPVEMSKCLPEAHDLVQVLKSTGNYFV